MDNLRITQELVEIAEDIRIGKMIKAWATTDLKILILRVDKSIVRYLKKIWCITKNTRCRFCDTPF